MILGCRLDHLRNSNVTVNGNTYRVGDNGICLDIDDADAECLLASPKWYRVAATTEGAIDFTRERTTPADAIPKTPEGQLAAIGLPSDWREQTESTAYMGRKEPTVAEWQQYEDAHLRAESAPQQQPMHPITPSTAAPVAPAVSAGAAYTPGIPPVEAPTLKEMSAPKSKRRGRPKKA